MDFSETQKKPAFENTLPLVNIVFLLLIFFMIAGSFSRGEILNIQTPEANFKDQFEKRQIIILMSPENQFAIDHQYYSQEKLIEFVQQKVKKTPELIVQIKADQYVKSQHLIEIMEALSSVNLKSIRLITSKHKNTY